MRREGGMEPETAQRAAGPLGGDGVAAPSRHHLPGPNPLQGVNASPSCPGCGRTFRRRRRNQRHCGSSCRVLALRHRREVGIGARTKGDTE